MLSKTQMGFLKMTPESNLRPLDRHSLTLTARSTRLNHNNINLNSYIKVLSSFSIVILVYRKAKKERKYKDFISKIGCFNSLNTKENPVKPVLRRSLFQNKLIALHELGESRFTFLFHVFARNSFDKKRLKSF